METKSIERIAQMHPLVREKVLAAYNEAVSATPKGVHPFITQTMRSFEESDALYAKGRDKKGNVIDEKKIVTNAPGGSSYHNYGLALDFVNLVDGVDKWVIDKNWMIVVDVFKKHGFKWGGEFKKMVDPPHFEMSFGYSVHELLLLHKEKIVDKDGYVKIQPK